MAKNERVILCPVCGGRVNVMHDDKVNYCEYCGSPVLGPSQSRDCANHRGVLAKGVCRVCGKLVCEKCIEKRVGDYGGKLLTIVNCTDRTCVQQSAWASPLNIEYLRLTDMDWADRTDNAILRVSGLGGVLMMVFELVMILALFLFQYLASWVPGTDLLEFIQTGAIVVILGILGNLLAAMILQTALQTYVHERQLGSGLMLLGLLVIEVVYLLFRGMYFNLRSFPNPLFLPMILGAFVSATIMVFFGALAAIAIGYKKRKQFRNARLKLGFK